MDASNLRIRLVFGKGVLSKYQKKDGLKHSWLLLKPYFQTISDIVSYILHSFDLHESCPYGIILSMDGFVLPEFESTSILEDKDLISVKPKKSRLLDAYVAIEEAKTYVEDEIVENLPSASGVKLLANEEFDRETEGYQSETDKDEDAAVKRRLPVQEAPIRDSPSKKRKASNKLQSSRKKRKLQAVVNTVRKKHVHDSENISKSSKKRKHKKSSSRNALASLGVTEKCIDGLKPESNAESELDENREDTMQESVMPVKKEVSRSTRRKRSIRLRKRLNRDKAKNDKELDKQEQVNDVSRDTGSKKDMMVENILQQYDEESDADGELVPVVIRPGLIRFTPSGKVKDVQENQEANPLDVHSTQNSTWKNHSVLKNVSDAEHNQVTTEAYCWNGITTKRKGQKWGQEMQPNSTWKETNGNTHSSSTWNGRQQSTSWKDSKDVNGHYSNTWTAKNHSTSSWHESGDINGQSNNTWADKEQHSNNKSVDHDQLIPLTDVPKAGDIVAYRLLELSSSWCPELSSFRVGKITSFEPDSNKVILVPVPEYPLNLEKNDDDDDGDEQPLGSSTYNEDGSLETDFTSLNDVRIMKLGDLTQSEGSKITATNYAPSPSTSKRVNEAQDGDLTQSQGTRILATNYTPSPSTSKRVNEAQDAKKVTSNVMNQELHNPKPANDKKDVWEEIAEAVSAKKTQLMQEDSWNKKETPAKRPWSYRSIRRNAIGPIMARLREQNGA